MNDARTLAERIAAASARIGVVPKNGRNDHFNYDYATDGDIADASRDALAAEGVAIFPKIDALQVKSEPIGDKGNRLWTVPITFVVTDGATREECPWIGQGTDTADKGVYKAVTGATKTFLVKLLRIATGDDDDPEREEGAPPRKENPQPVNEQNPACPECGKPNAMKSTRGPGYYCNPKEFKGRKGCGLAFGGDDPTASTEERVAAGRAAMDSVMKNGGGKTSASTMTPEEFELGLAQVTGDLSDCATALDVNAFVSSDTAKRLRKEGGIPMSEAIAKLANARRVEIEKEGT